MLSKVLEATSEVEDASKRVLHAEDDVPIPILKADMTAHPETHGSRRSLTGYRLLFPALDRKVLIARARSGDASTPRLRAGNHASPVVRAALKTDRSL